MFDDQLGPFKMTHAGRTLRIIHRIGHVAHEKHVLTDADHLTDGEGPAENAHVRVHAHHDHVLNPALLKQIVRFC